MVDCQIMSANMFGLPDVDYPFTASEGESGKLATHTAWGRICVRSRVDPLFPINPIHSIPFYKIAYNTIAFTTFIYFFSASKKAIILIKIYWEKYCQTIINIIIIIFFCLKCVPKFFPDTKIMIFGFSK